MWFKMVLVYIGPNVVYFDSKSLLLEALLKIAQVPAANTRLKSCGVHKLKFIPKLEYGW